MRSPRQVILEVAGVSEMSVNICQKILCHIEEENCRYVRRRQNTESPSTS